MRNLFSPKQEKRWKIACWINTMSEPPLAKYLPAPKRREKVKIETPWFPPKLQRHENSNVYSIFERRGKIVAQAVNPVSGRFAKKNVAVSSRSKGKLDISDRLDRPKVSIHEAKYVEDFGPVKVGADVEVNVDHAKVSARIGASENEPYFKYMFDKPTPTNAVDSKTQLG